jgi:adenylate kinase
MNSLAQTATHVDHLTGTPAPRPASPQDLEIKDAHLIFNAVWMELENEFGRENLRFPREIILLGGAPGSGKGTNTEFIMSLRDITCEPLVMSALLDSPEARRIKDAGGMVGDREAVSILFRKLLEPDYQNGALIDGFPRTNVQVECCKLLYDRMLSMHREFDGTPHARHFRRPTFHIVVLFVEERESINRQLKRGREIEAHNEKVRMTGVGTLMELRPTDLDVELARKRYQTFKEKTWDALESLKKIFHYHFINAMGPIEEVQRNIVQEFQYQSSLELDPRTFEAIKGIPLASEITVHARQELVRRLDSYELEASALFKEVVEFIDRKIMPIVQRHAISGQANINSEDPLLENPHALAMLIDVLSERGFQPVVDVHRIEVPQFVDLTTGQITCRVKRVVRFIIRFRGSEIRRGH